MVINNLFKKKDIQRNHVREGGFFLKVDIITV